MKKLLAITLIAIIAASTLGLIACASATPFMNWKNAHGIGNNKNTPTQQSFVRIDGILTQWGAANITGGIQAQSRTLIHNASEIREGSSATLIWTANTTRAINSAMSKQNFTYTFYSARLITADTYSINETGYSYVLNGTWNVNQVTTNTTIITNSTTGAILSVNRNQTITPIAQDAYGELKVTAGTNSFTVSITGIDDLTGVVRIERITTRLFNPFIINSFGGVTNITKTDIHNIANCYGASPGWGNYDQHMDYNFNYKVDICDLATAAANVDS
jgi:hypothetical protein